MRFEVQYRPRQRLLLAILTAANTVALAAAADYLPKVGPPPLRFALPRTPSQARYVLPPLEIPRIATNDAATNQVVAEAAAPPAAIAPVDATNSVPVNPILPEAVPTNAVPLMVAEAPAFYPQMFLQYFRDPGTNQATNSLLVPMTFLPPAPMFRPSSSAGYETTPAGKP